ncbi:MAG: ABC transporter permease, partial [Planctomycetota bacterium]|nr:ABC transporter permease [Planctomycetota bacterium]
MWRYRELLFQLVKRDFSGMYRQTFVGAGWAIISPVITMIVFTVVFGNMAKLPSDGIPYPLFCFSG